MAREAGMNRPEDTIRSIYAARSAASALSSTGDFARMKSIDPAQPLRAAFISHLSAFKEEVPREGGDLTDTVLRKAYVAHALASTKSSKP